MDDLDIVNFSGKNYAKFSFGFPWEHMQSSRHSVSDYKW